MFASRLDDLSADVQLDDQPGMREQFLDPLENDRAVGVVLVAGGDPIVRVDPLDELEALVGENLRPRRTPRICSNFKDHPASTVATNDLRPSSSRFPIHFAGKNFDCRWTVTWFRFRSRKQLRGRKVLSM